MSAAERDDLADGELGAALTSRGVVRLALGLDQQVAEHLAIVARLAEPRAS